MSYHSKLELLKQELKNQGQALIAFSGGVDSTLLLKVAKDVLGKNVLAVTVRSPLFPDRELKEAQTFCANQGIEHLIIASDVLRHEGFRKNPVDRCYICKKLLFKEVLAIADQRGVKYVAEGSNQDDLADFRPGRKALLELGIESPLLKAGLTKEEIRILSQKYGLVSWDKPSLACLASRIPYGEEITEKKLRMVDLAEQYLRDLGFKQVRVRFHGDLARIEVPASDNPRIVDPSIAEQIYNRFAELGFLYTTLDLKGYRCGSLNEKFHYTIKT
ncbi:MAG: ATP-dependent sacrificial sulfur transferase LarE [Peptococcaceae bacterium]|nr:ATP-dependent sacrificial sulfur transferase LarE [Peptococcaceae bacterium]